MATKTSSVRTTTTKATATKRPLTQKGKITADTIRLRAEEIYRDRINNGNHGDELSDWLQAERELKSVY
jgi:hypothetical protein